MVDLISFPEDVKCEVRGKEGVMDEFSWLKGGGGGGEYVAFVMACVVIVGCTEITPVFKD